MSTISVGEKKKKSPLSRRGGWKTLIQNYVDSIARSRLLRETRDGGERERERERSEELARNAAKCFDYSSLSRAKARARGTARTKANVYGVFISCTFRRRGGNQKTGSIPAELLFRSGFLSLSLSFLFFSFFTRYHWILDRSLENQGEPAEAKGLLLYRVS